MLTIVSRGSDDLAVEITSFAGMMTILLYSYKHKQMFWSNHWKRRAFSLLWGPHHKFSCPTSSKITDLSDLLDKMRTFSLIWGPQREFSGPTSFAITVLLNLLVKMQTFYIYIYGDLIGNLVVQLLLKLQFCRIF